MSKSDFHTIRKLKLQVRVLVFSVLNVSELIRGLTRARNLKKQCTYMQDFFLKTPLLIYLISFQNFFSKIWVAKLGVRLICECGLYAGVYGTFSVHVFAELSSISRWPETTSIICHKRAHTHESNQQNLLSDVLEKGI